MIDLSAVKLGFGKHIDAARAAARAAAWAAVEDAAARDRLQSAVVRIQQSAADLIIRMANLKPDVN